MSIFIEYHVIENLPPSNINRDETGAPKTAYYGGCNRQRVSSQAWKRATREAFGGLIADAQRATRTKRVVKLLADRIQAFSDLERDEAVTRATKVLGLAGIKVKQPRVKKGEEAPAESYEAEALVFVSNQQLQALAELASGSDTVEKKAAKAAVDTRNGIEVALFGRMVASSPDLNVDAAVQVAHAISTHQVDPQGDFYTAVDDEKRGPDDDAGAGMMGTIEFASATLYRYAAISLDQLQENLGDAEVTAEAVAAFTQAFLTSMPSGKQNSMAADTLPSAVLIMLRDTRPVSLVGAFERPIRRSEDGFLAPSVKAMVGQVDALHEAFGLAPITTWAVGEPKFADVLGQVAAVASLPAVVSQLRAEVLKANS